MMKSRLKKFSLAVMVTAGVTGLQITRLSLKLRRPARSRAFGKQRKATSSSKYSTPVAALRPVSFTAIGSWKRTVRPSRRTSIILTRSYEAAHFRASLSSPI
jgi:hypothetical protein